MKLEELKELRHELNNSEDKLDLDEMYMLKELTKAIDHLIKEKVGEE